MKKKTLIWIIIWVIITLINYYYTNFFFLGFIWIGMIVFFVTRTITELSNIIKERKNVTRFSILKFIVFTSLLFFTFQRHIPNNIIEKVDWEIFENKRTEIVEQVKIGNLKPNVTWNSWVCELPFEFPIVSNGGNDIGISRSKSNNSLTIQFWVFRNFFDNPSTYFIYSNNKEIINRLEKKIDEKPKYNWKLKKNWYRIYGGY